MSSRNRSLSETLKAGAFVDAAAKLLPQMRKEAQSRAVELYPHAVLSQARYQGCEPYFDDRVPLKARVAGRMKVLQDFADGKSITADLVVRVDGSMDRRVGAAFAAYGVSSEVRFSAMHGVKLARDGGGWMRINSSAFIGTAEIPAEFDGPMTVAPELLAKGGPFRVDLQLGQDGARIQVASLSTVLSMRSVALALLRANRSKLCRREIMARLRAGAIPSFKALQRGGTRVTLPAGSGRKTDKEVFKARASVHRWLGERLAVICESFAAQGESAAKAWAASPDLQYENALRAFNRAEDAWQSSARNLFESWNRVCFKTQQLIEVPTQLPSKFAPAKASAGKSDAFHYERAKEMATNSWEELIRATEQLATFEGGSVAAKRSTTSQVAEPAAGATGQMGLCFA